MQVARPVFDQPRCPALAVLDTNVVLDWLVFKDARIAPLVDALQAGQLTWLSCPSIRLELVHMLGHRSLAVWSPDPKAALEAHDRYARLLPNPDGLPQPRPRCSDADDQVFVDLALSGSAHCLLTHDRALLRLAKRLRAMDVAVMTPMQWAATFRA